MPTVLLHSCRLAESSSPVPATAGAGVVVAPALDARLLLGRPRNVTLGIGTIWSCSARAARIERKCLCARAPEESISTARKVPGTSVVVAAVVN
jgi:hypothetical protein